MTNQIYPLASTSSSLDCFTAASPIHHSNTFLELAHASFFTTRQHLCVGLTNGQGPNVAAYGGPLMTSIRIGDNGRTFARTQTDLVVGVVASGPFLVSKVHIVTALEHSFLLVHHTR